MRFSIPISCSVTAESIDDVIHCAIGGGIRDWYQRCAFNSVTDETPNYFVEDIDGKENVHRLTRAKVKRGLNLLASQAPARFERCFMGDRCGYDAEDADVFLQLCLFGKITYG